MGVVPAPLVPRGTVGDHAPTWAPDLGNEHLDSHAHVGAVPRLSSHAGPWGDHAPT